MKCSRDTYSSRFIPHTSCASWLCELLLKLWCDLVWINFLKVIPLDLLTFEHTHKPTLFLSFSTFMSVSSMMPSRRCEWGASCRGTGPARSCEYERVCMSVYVLESAGMYVFDSGLKERWDISLTHPIQGAAETVWRPTRLFYLSFPEQQGGGGCGDGSASRVFMVCRYFHACVFEREDSFI